VKIFKACAHPDRFEIVREVWSDHRCYPQDVEQETTKPSDIEPGVAASLEELAAQQKVQRVTDFDALLGHSSAEDESADEFAAMLRGWRWEGARPTRRR